MLRDYFGNGLDKYPDLEFELVRVFPGMHSVTLFYKSVNKLLATEVMELDSEGKAVRVLAHYAPKYQALEPLPTRG